MYRHALMLSLLLAACDSGSEPAGRPRDAGTPTRDGSASPSRRDAAVADSGGGAEPEPGGEMEPGERDAEVAKEDSAVRPPPTDYTREECVLVPTAQGDGPAGSAKIKVEVVVEGLEIPWGLAWLPNGDLLITERPGRLRLLRGGQLQGTPVLSVDVARISFLEERGLGSEGGLLGVTLHPDFENTRQFYMYFTARGANNTLINKLGLYELAEDNTTATLQRVLLDNIESGIHHQGGRMAIGPDGKLYVGVGAYTPTLAQMADKLPGKLLRLNLDGTTPDDNPTPGSPVFLTGVRNTQGFDWFDDHHMLVMDHGPTSIDPGVPEKGWDEFNVVRGGDNLGWPDVRGCSAQANISEPVIVFERSLPPGGGAIYRGTSIPAWKGSFLVGTLGLPNTDEGQHLHLFKVSADNPYVVEKHETYLKGEHGRLRTVAMGPDGHLYVTTSNCDSRGMSNGRCANGGDKLLRIVGAN